MSDDSQLSDKNFTHKLTVLIALPSASSASSIQHLNIKFMAGMTRPVNFIFINCKKAGKGVEFHQQSDIRHTHKILNFALLRH